MSAPNVVVLPFPTRDDPRLITARARMARAWVACVGEMERQISEGVPVSEFGCFAEWAQ